MPLLNIHWIIKKNIQVQTRLKVLLKKKKKPRRTKAHFQKKFYESMEHPHAQNIPGSSISRDMNVEA